MRTDGGVARTPSRAPVYVVVGGLALAVTLVLLAAAAARQPAPAPGIDRPGTRGIPRDVNVIMRDYAFVPAPVTLVRGETVRFHVLNGGLVAHEFVVGDARAQDAWDRADSAATPPGAFTTAPPASVASEEGGLRLLLASGAQSEIAFTVPVTGELSLACHLPGHLQRGMASGVVLREAAAGPSPAATAGER